MLLRRISPMANFGQFGRDMERLLNGFLPEVDIAANRSRAFPPLNVWEEGDEYFIEAEVPGLSMDHLDLEVLGNEVIIKGHRQAPPHENVTIHRQERGDGEFSRMLTLPVEIDANRVEATLRNGVLLVKLPKAETAKARKIQVKAIE
ncbi:MAG: Hsp20/alpha crystallin family protein [Phycisphaerae bacterium]|nr:Hsp20/alpha crystallin family protein [Phycisphaerae bacterium]